MVVLLALAGGLLGCKSTPGNESFKSETGPGGKKVSVSVSGEPASNSQGKASTRAVAAISGRVVSVNDRLRFVIVDFANNVLPQLEQKLSVYRLDQKVAEIRISGPYQGTSVAADITAGEARENDLVKLN